MRRDPIQSRESVPPRKLVLSTVQVLRGVAALMVGFYHLTTQIPAYAPLLWPSFWPAGSAVMAHGVDIFFVISGFIMLVSSRDMRAADFMARRIIRIVPLYWMFTLLLIAGIAVKADLFHSTTVTAGSAIKSFAFVPFFNPANPDKIWPLLVPGWTLNYEMFFYLVFAATLFAPFGRRILLCMLVFTVFASIRLVPGFEHSAVLQFYSSPIIFEFVGGMIVGRLFLSSWKLPVLACLGMIGVGFVLLLTKAQPQSEAEAASLLTSGLPSCLIVLGAVQLDKVSGITMNWKLPLSLGDASYSIYLSHIFTLGVARGIWSWVNPAGAPQLDALGFAVFGMSAVALVGVACYRMVEKPLLEWSLRNWKRRWRATPRVGVSHPA